MRGQGRTSLTATLALLLLAGCSGEVVESTKTPAVERATRRAYDGAPPVIPHAVLGIACVECHSREGKPVEGLGFAPPSPHEETLGMGPDSRCTQCHVFSQSEAIFAVNRFEGLRQDLRKGTRLADGSPPTIPHKTLMRENCMACHSGPAAREEIRTTHPERTRCRQCHVPVTTRALFQETR